ncbi:MAG: hypothetical protein RIB32_01380 [Phycisphaerales bacterium]
MDISSFNIQDVLSSVNRLSAPAALRGDESQRAFRDALGIARTANAGEEASRDAAEQFVAKTFLEPLLKSVRENNQAAPPFAPTQAEKQFRAFADAQLAVEIVKRADMPIVDRLARDLLA